MTNSRATTASSRARWLAGGLAATCLATVVLLSVSAFAGGDRTGGRGDVVSIAPLATLPDSAAVAARLRGDRFDAGTARYGVRTYRLAYRTIDPAGRPTTASGLVALPINRHRWLRTVSFAHGTEVYRGDAPSVSDDGFVRAPAITFASAGFAAVEPDYLGLGTGPGPHPWMDLASETTASVDMLRAARAFVASTGRQLGRQVFVTGFSQGASAALGLAHALQQGRAPWFRARAVAPISGAYDLRHAEIPAALAGRLHPMWATAYTAYLLVAWDRLYDIYDSPAEVFAPAYRDVARLFDGDHPGDAVLAGLPDTIDKLLTPAGFDLLRHPGPSFTAAMRDLYGACTRWTPRMPVRLYYSPADEQAANANTFHCHGALGAPVVDLGVNTGYDGSVHEGSEILGVAAAARWFRTI